MALADAAPYAIAVWTLDEASGTRYDSVGSHDLTDNNTVGSAAGLVDGNSADFERDNQEYLSYAHGSDLDFTTGKFSITFYFSYESISPFSSILIGKGTIGSTENYTVILDVSTSKLKFRVTKVGVVQTTVTASTFGALSSGTTYAATVYHDPDSDQIGISVNGQKDTASHSTNITDSNIPFRIGGDGSYGSYDGKMDEVVILGGYIVSDEDISEHYNAGVGKPFADWAGGGGGFDPANGFPWNDQTHQVQTSNVVIAY